MLLLWLWLGFVQAEGPCIPASSSLYRNYSTKTPYKYIVDDLGPDPFELNECQTTQVWSVVRHGTRYPSPEAIRFMTEDLVELQKKILSSPNTLLCQKDLDRIAKWQPSVTANQSKDLHPEGEKELILMGERMVERYSSLLGDYHHQDFIFRATDTQRSKESAKHFAIGMFTRPVANRVKYEDPIKPHDPLIRFYKLCQKWTRDVKKNPNSRVEHEQFSLSHHVLDVRKNMTRLLGFHEEISLADLDKLYVNCNFDQAWKPQRISPWCTLFTDKALEVMEYREDLEYYWVDGPGNEINYAPACVLLQNVYQNFHNVTLGVEEERGIFYFTHSGTLLKLIAFLNVAPDAEHLKSDNFSSMREHRKWRTSRVGPFAGNVSFTLKQCGSFLVCLYVNEQATPIPGCGTGCCPWEKFTKLFKDRLDSCHFDKMCENTKDKMTETATDDRY